MAIKGLWGSFFSRIEGKAMAKPFRRGFMSPVEVVVGEPISPQQVSPEGLRQRVAELLGA
jgi:hypothetical protein